MVVHRLSDMSQKTVPNCGDRHPAGVVEPARWRRLPLSGVRQGDARNARTLPQPRAFIHAIVHVQYELRGSSRNACAICTRLWAFTSPSPEVSIGRKIMSLNLLTTADCTPSDCEQGMQPKGFRASTMWHSLCTV